MDPEPFALTTRFSFVPDEMAAKDTPDPAAAPMILMPVAAEPEAELTLRVGLVVPFGPTARAFALLEVTVSEPVIGSELTHPHKEAPRWKIAPWTLQPAYPLSNNGPRSVPLGKPCPLVGLPQA
jgi:hypothetical protein